MKRTTETKQTAQDQAFDLDYELSLQLDVIATTVAELQAMRDEPDLSDGYWKHYRRIATRLERLRSHATDGRALADRLRRICEQQEEGR